MIALLASTLFAAAWKGTLLVTFALVVHRVARNRIPARWMCALLLVGIIRLLMPVAPQSSFSVFNLLQPHAAAPSPVIVLEGQPRLPALEAARVPEPVPPPRAPWMAPVLLAVWAAGAAFCLARVAVQSIRFRKRLRDLRPVDLGGLIEQCCTALLIRRRVRVAETGAVDTPSLHGWLRPTLLLPHRFLESFSREQLRYVVLHELAHLRRADVLVSWIATAAAALHWYNPLVRLAVARLFEERELACDALALAALRADERPAYGGTVLEIAERSPALVPALVGMTATPRQLKRRIVMIASFKQSRASIVFAALVAVLALATLTDAQAGEPRTFTRIIEGEPLSPAAHEQMERLEKAIDVDLRNATLRDVLNAISNATGVTATIAEGALEGDPRLNVQGTRVPAHVVLMETLVSLELAPKFTDTGVEVVREPARVMIHPAPGEDRVFFMRERRTHEGALPADAPAARKSIEIRAEQEDGKRTVTINGGEGKLEIEVLK